MGCYINPSKQTKEEFLFTHGRRINSPAEAGADEFPVCLINNGVFTAAGIAYDAKEITAMTEPGDLRPKSWFAVQKDALAPYLPEVK